MLEVLCRFQMLYCLVFIREKAIGHDFDKIRFGRINIFRLALKEFFYKFRMLEGIRMDFIF